MVIWFRRIASCLFATLAILSAALWVRSWYYLDIVTQTPREPQDIPLEITLRSGQGIAVCEYHNFPRRTEDGEVRWRRVMVPLRPPMNKTLFLTFDWEAWTQAQGDSLRRLTIPTWTITVPNLLLAIAIRPKPRFKFGLRDLLRLTTVAALVIGPLALWLRGIG